MPVVTGCRVEQGPGPRQVTEATGHRRLADHGVGRHPRVGAAADRFGVKGVGGFVIALPGPQRGQGDQATGSVVLDKVRRTLPEEALQIGQLLAKLWPVFAVSFPLPGQNPGPAASIRHRHVEPRRAIAGAVPTDDRDDRAAERALLR